MSSLIICLVLWQGGEVARAYLLRVLFGAHKTPGTQFVTARANSTSEVLFKMDVALIIVSQTLRQVHFCRFLFQLAKQSKISFREMKIKKNIYIFTESLWELSRLMLLIWHMPFKCSGLGFNMSENLKSPSVTPGRNFKWDVHWGYLLKGNFLGFMKHEILHIMI